MENNGTMGTSDLRVEYNLVFLKEASSGIY